MQFAELKWLVLISAWIVLALVGGNVCERGRAVRKDNMCLS